MSPAPANSLLDSILNVTGGISVSEIYEKGQLVTSKIQRMA